MFTRYLYSACICFSVCSLISPFGFGQTNKKLDSLLISLQKEKTGTGKASLLVNISQQFLQEQDLTSAKKYATDAIATAAALGNAKNIEAAYLNDAHVSSMQGIMFLNQGNFPAALNHFLAALKVFEKYRSVKAIAGSNLNLGQVYYARKNFEPAMKCFSTALELFRELKDKNGIAGTYNDIGLVHEGRKEDDEAIKFYKLAIDTYNEAGNKWATIDRYFNIGFFYEDRGNYAEALKYHGEALELSKTLGIKKGMAAAYSNIASVYNNKEEYEEASKNYLLALDLYRQLNDKEGVGVTNTNMANLYINQKDYGRAKKFLADALPAALELGSIEGSKMIYQMMITVDSVTGNWEEALRHHRLYILYRDSATGEEASGKMIKAQMQYDFDKKEEALKYNQLLTAERLKRQTLLSQQQQQTIQLRENELALANNERKLQQLQLEKNNAEEAIRRREAEKNMEQLVLLQKEKDIQQLQLKKQHQQKYYLVALMSLFLLLAFFVYLAFKTKHRLRIQTLRNKIASDLHDEVGSTLSSISIFSEAARQQLKEPMPVLETIGESSRKTLDAISDIVWAINPENDDFEKIILRMKNFAYNLLGAKNIDFEFIVDEEAAKMQLPMETRKNLYLVFKEATNNLVKHSGADKVLFAITKQKPGIVMVIKDNGKGFSVGDTLQGNGLLNMRKRSEASDGKLTIDSNPGAGTSIELTIPT